MAKAAKKKPTSRKSVSSKSKTATKKAAPAKQKIDLFASVDEIEKLAAEIKSELTDFDQKGVKAAARRARKALQLLRKLCGQTRKDITETVKASK
jgi:hypothetical protein